MHGFLAISLASYLLCVSVTLTKLPTPEPPRVLAVNHVLIQCQDGMARLACFIAFEHVVFIIKLLAMWLIPDIPKGITRL